MCPYKVYIVPAHREILSRMSIAFAKLIRFCMLCCEVVVCLVNKIDLFTNPSPDIPRHLIKNLMRNDNRGVDPFFGWGGGGAARVRKVSHFRRSPRKVAI